MKLKFPPLYFQGALGLFLCMAVAYFWIKAGLFHTGFLGEDFAYLRYNIHSPKPWLWSMVHPNEFGQFRPLGHQLYFVVTKWLFQLNPTPYHVLQLTIHLANTLLVFFLLRLLSPNTLKNSRYTTIISALCAFLWAIQANHAKAIFWVSATNNLLYSFFGLIFFCLLLKKNSAIVLQLFILTLALASKEFAVLLPVLAFFLLTACTDFYKKKIYSLLPHFSLVAFYLIYRLFFHASFADNFSPQFNTRSELAALTYLSWGFQFLEPMAPFAAILFLLLAFFQKTARGFLFFPIFILFLSLWPDHVMPEFLYLGSLGIIVAIHAMLVKKLARPILWITILSLLLFLFYITPKEFSFAQNTQKYLQKRSEIYTRTHEQLELIPTMLENKKFWKNLNQDLGAEIAHIPWYVDLYWPERFPCLTDNFRKSFSSLGAKDAVTTLTPSLFQCASSSK